MSLSDFLALTVFSLICTLLYLGGSSLMPLNRREPHRIVLSAATVLGLCISIWYTVFAGPFARNWGLGGSYLWMTICPTLYLISGVILTICNIRRKNKKR